MCIFIGRDMLIIDKIFWSFNIVIVKEFLVIYCCLFKNESKLKLKILIVVIDYFGSNLSVIVINRNKKRFFVWILFIVII